MKKVYLFLFVTFLFFSCSNKSDDLNSLNENELSQKINEFYQNKNFLKSAEAIEVFVKKYPQNPRSSEYLLNLALLYTNDLKNINSAITQYKRIINEYPNSKEAPNALFTLGFIYANELKDFSNAKIYYEEFLKKYPQHEAAVSVKFELENLGKNPDDLINNIQNNTNKSNK